MSQHGTGTAAELLQSYAHDSAALSHNGTIKLLCCCHAGGDPELSTILVGPWLDLWPTTHTNKHTQAWQALKQQQQQAEQQQQQPK